jgi:hypothetical protein
MVAKSAGRWNPFPGPQIASGERLQFPVVVSRCGRHRNRAIKNNGANLPPGGGKMQRPPEPVSRPSNRLGGAFTVPSRGGQILPQPKPGG